MPQSIAQAAELYETLGEGGSSHFSEVRVNFASGGSCPDDVIVCFDSFAAPHQTDGKQNEVSVGFVMYDHITTIPVVDIIKLAIQQAPELVERAYRELELKSQFLELNKPGA